MKQIGLVRPAMPPHSRHANTTGTIRRLRIARIAAVARSQNSGAPTLDQNSVRRSGNLTCDKASPDVAVMLHLRACYVSKAAILTIPAPRVPVENRSPA